MSASIIVVLAIVAAHIAGYYLYIQGIRAGLIRPEPTTWSLWVLETSTNVPMYFVATHHDWMKNALPIVDWLGAIIVWGTACYLGRFAWPKREDYGTIAAVVVAFLVWMYYDDPLNANTILQMGVFISFLPLARKAWKDPSVESPVPWMFWSAAYALDGVLVLMQPHRLQELGFPIVCFLVHFVLGIIAQRGTHLARRNQ